jgi:hypothetical protein
MLSAVTDTVPDDEVARLKQELEAAQAKLSRRAMIKARLRGSGLALLLVLGCGLVALSLVAFYVRETVLDTNRYVETMAPIAESPAVQQAVAEKLDNAITTRIDFDSLIREALPDQADALAPVFAGALQQAIRNRLDQFVASDNFQRLWDEANRRAHGRVVALLTTGESGRLLLDGDTVYLDLGAIVDRVRQGLQERGLDRLAAAIPPTVDGRITLLQSEGLVKAREGVDLIERLTIVLPILALLCLAAHVFWSRPRRRGLLRVGLGLIVTSLILVAAAGIGRSAYLDAINQDVLPRQAAADIFDALIELLRTGVRVIVVVAVLVALLALVLGRTDAIASRTRGALRGVAGGRQVGWVAEHRGLLQGAVVALGAVVLFSWDPPTAGVVLITAVLVVAAVALIAAVAGARQGATGA